MCGVWARSGDIWGKRDSFLYHYRDCSDHINNQYTIYISGPNSEVDDWVKGGLMARSSLARSSPYFGVFRVGEHHGIRIQYRVAAQGTTISEEKQLGPERLFDADTLVFVKLSIGQAGHRARPWGSVDGHKWTEVGRYEFPEPLKYQGIGALSANVRETRSTQRIRVGRRQRKRTCWDCEREWKRMVVPLEPGRPSEARQLLRTQR